MRILYYNDLLPVKGIRYSKVQLWRKMKAGTFPAPLPGLGRLAWTEADIDDWIAGLVARRDAERGRGAA